MNQRAVAYAMLSAMLFGVSTPAAKALLGTIEPFILAGLLYSAAGLGVALVRRLLQWSDSGAPREAALERQDVPWLASAILAGGIVGPVLLMVGLTQTDAASASLLLTLEGVATALLAWFVFHEGFDRRIALGMAFLVAGAMILGWTGGLSWSGLVGPLAIVGACLAWGLDNNLTRKVSLSDPLEIVQLKGLIAGPVTLVLGFWAGGSLPPALDLAAAGVVGFLGYGVSLALFVMALRHLGAARTGAYFSTAPFIGTLAAVALLGEPITHQLVLAGALMGIGVWLHLTEDHEHAHVHEPIEHAHLHIHDEHHQHTHRAEDAVGEPHSHGHRHAPLRHKHPHMHHVHKH